MAELKINGRMTVKTLKENFKKEFEGTLRVYNGKKIAEDSATLASIRSEDAKGGELVCRANRTVGGFEKEMKEVFGINVQVASPDDFVLALDGITLANLKNIKKYSSKADMEVLLAYKHKDASSEDKQQDDILLDEENLKEYQNETNKKTILITVECIHECYSLKNKNGKIVGAWDGIQAGGPSISHMLIEEYNGNGECKELYSTREGTLDLDSLINEDEDEVQECLDLDDAIDVIANLPNFDESEDLSALRIYRGVYDGEVEHEFEIDGDFDLSLLEIATYSFSFPDTEQLFYGLWYDGERINPGRLGYCNFYDPSEDEDFGELIYDDF